MPVINCISFIPKDGSQFGTCADGIYPTTNAGRCMFMCKHRKPKDSIIVATTDQVMRAVRSGTARETFSGSAMWAILHGRASAFGGDACAEAKWMDAEFSPKVPCGACKADWLKFVAGHPPDLSSAEAYFLWTWEAHNTVNAKLGKPLFSLAEAKARWTT